MSRKWQLQEAKNRVGEMVNDAILSGPQTVTRHGEETVIVLSMKDYKKLAKSKISLYEFLRNSPLRGVELDMARDRSLPRGMEL